MGRARRAAGAARGNRDGAAMKPCLPLLSGKPTAEDLAKLFEAIEDMWEILKKFCHVVVAMAAVGLLAWATSPSPRANRHPISAAPGQALGGRAGGQGGRRPDPLSNGCALQKRAQPKGLPAASARAFQVRPVGCRCSLRSKGRTPRADTGRPLRRTNACARTTPSRPSGRSMNSLTLINVVARFP